jgi:diguanylate cyclase (GGDEF)-like protein
VVVIGEMLPIEFARRGRPTDEVTISTMFVLALVLAAPLWVALVAQALPLVVDDLKRRKHWSRPVFNVSQYALAILAARGVYAVLSRHDLVRPEILGPADLPAALLAGLAFIAVNHGLVGTAVALSVSAPVLDDLLDDAGFELATSGILAAFAPMVLVAVSFSPWLLPLMLLPVVAVRRSAQLSAQREHDALHDRLTGLPNRTLFQHHLADAVEVVRPGGRTAAVLVLDLDHFKEINDTLGHDMGDLLLVEVAARLDAVRTDGVLVARLGGDEFALLLPVAATQDVEETARTLGRRVLGALAEPMTLGKVRVDVAASIGIALAPLHGSDAGELMARADVAMYAAKEDHRGCALYDPEQDRHTPERLELLADLREAVQRGQLVLHYQPKIAAATGEVAGAEALVRWQHPRLGLLPPDAFVELAENTGLIAELTLAVLDEALAQLRTWLDLGHRLTMAVNLSVRHLGDDLLPDHVAAALRRHRVPAALLSLEVTEGTLMKDPARAATVLGRLRALGVSIAVDDYGTGYSSLAYLTRLAVDELKIDKSFVLGLGHEGGGAHDAVVVRSTIELGHNLGLRVVAEGVEDAQAHGMLRDWGCDLVQGYHHSRPVPAEDFVELVSARRPVPAQRVAGTC